MGDAPRQLSNAKVSVKNLNSTGPTEALCVVMLDSTGGIITGAAGASTQVSIREMLTSSGASVIDSTNASIGVTIRAGSAAGTEYTDGDIDATISGGALVFDNSSNTLRPVTLTRGLPVNIVAGSASSTIVTVSTGSVRVHQSTAADLQVTVAGYSTVMSVSTGSVRVHQSTAADLNVTVAGYVAPSTIITVSTGSVRVHQSTAADLNVTVAGYVAPSTTVAVSSVSGVVAVMPGSSGATGFYAVRLSDGSTFVTDSTQRAIRVTSVDVGGSTQVSVSTGNVQLTGVHDLAGVAHKVGDSTNNAIRVNVVAGSAAGSTEVTVRQSTYTDFNALSRIADRDASTQVAGVLNAAPASTVWALAIREVSPTTSVRVFQSTAADLNVTVAGYVAPTTIVTVSTGSVRVHQSSAADLNVTVAGYTAPTTLATVRQSTYTDFNTLSRLADRDLSTQVAAVLNAAPVSTVYGLAVRPVGVSSVSQNSTVWAVQVDGRVRAQNSTIGDLLASVQQNSTVWAVQIPSSQSVQVKNSTIGDLLASVQQNSTVWQTQARLQDSSGVGLVGVTTRPSTGAQGLVVRTVLNDLLSTCFSTLGNNSTSSTVVSSVAALRHKVFAYSITSTAQAVNTLSFASSLANPIWCVQMQSMTSGITGANLAVSPPAWLFATEAASPLVFKVTGTTGTYHVAFSYFSEA